MKNKLKIVLPLEVFLFIFSTHFESIWLVVHLIKEAEKLKSLLAELLSPTG